MASVIKRNDRWTVILAGQPTKSGQRWLRLPASIRTKTAATKEALRLQEDWDRQRLGMPTQSPTASAPAWLELAARLISEKTARAKTRANREWLDNLERYAGRFAAFLAERSVADVTRAHCREYVAKRLAEPKSSPSTVRKEATFIAQVFRRAVHEDHIPSNPWDGLQRPSEPPAKDRFLSPAEFAALLAAAPPDRAFLYQLLALTGARKGEALRLHWADVDIDARLIRITNAAKGRTTSTQRTAYRSVPIPEDLLPALVQRRATPAELVLGDGQQSGLNWPRNLNRDAKKAGLGHLRIHDLRHTYGSWLAQARIPLRQIQALMGHAHHVTTERYAHLVPDQHPGVSAAFDAILCHGFAGQSPSPKATVIDLAKEA